MTQKQMERDIKFFAHLHWYIHQILFSNWKTSIKNIQYAHVNFMCILYNQWDATYTVFFIIISALHVLGGISAHHQELIKLNVQPWVLSCFPAVYRWCGWIPTALQWQPTLNILTGYISRPMACTSGCYYRF